MSEINFRYIATQLGNNLKYVISVNEIDRVGQSILRVNKESFPNASITSVRAQSVNDWILSLAKTPLEEAERIKRLINFCLELTPEEYKKATIELLEKNHCPYNLIYKDSIDEFLKRNFHPEVVQHSQRLFAQGNYFHAVFESSKAYNKDVKSKPTARSVSLSWGAREVGSPCEWRGGAR